MAIDYDTTEIKVNESIHATVELRYNGPGSALQMVLIDLRAPVGFAFIETDFQQLLARHKISHYEIRGRQALVYLDDLQRDELVTFGYSLKALWSIRAAIQGVHAYDMYDMNVNTELPPTTITSYGD